MTDEIKRGNNEEGVSLREYFEAEIKNVKLMIATGSQEAKDAVKAALDSQKEAVLKSETASEKRFSSVNEFRATLSDQQRNLMPRVEVEILTKSIVDRIDKIENKQIANEMKGGGIKEGWGWAVGVIGLVGALIAIVFAFTK